MILLPSTLCFDFQSISVSLINSRAKANLIDKEVAAYAGTLESLVTLDGSLFAQETNSCWQ